MNPRPNLRLWPRSNTNALWTLADSAASSASNFVLGSLVAIRSTPELYGRFALAFALYSLTFGVWRAWATEPFLLGIRRLQNSIGSVIGACGLLGGAAMLVGLVASTGVDSASRSLVLVVAVSLPILAAHDGIRYCLIGSGRAHLALAIDASWLVLMLAGSTEITEPAPLILWWSASSALTLLLGLRFLSWPNLSGGIQWLRQTSSVGMRFIFEFAVFTGSNSAIMFAVGFSSGLAEMGAYRGAAVLVGPAAVIVNGLVTVALTTVSSDGSAVQTPDDAKKIRSRVQKLAALSLLAGVGWSVIVLALPSSIGENVLGETWAPIRLAAVPLSLAVGGQAIISVATAGYRLLGQINKGARVKAIGMGLVMVGGCAASFYDQALYGGAFAASTGFAVVAIGVGLVVVWLFGRDTGNHSERLLDRVAVDVGFALNETDPFV